MKTIRYEIDADQIATLTLDDPEASVNTMSPQWQLDFADAVERLAADKDQIRGVIIASAKSTFCAGGDLKGLQHAEASDAPALFAQFEEVKKQLRRLETLGKPVVACLNGSALGGGLEIALAAHHRIAVDNPKIQFGLPEVTLGLLPGAGGVTKLVRLVGLLEALPYLLEGKSMKPAEAVALGLVQQLVATPEELRSTALAWIDAHPVATQPWDVKGYRLPGGSPSSPNVAQALPALAPRLRQKTRGLLPAPEAILACAVEGAQVDFDSALRLESRALAHLVTSPVAKNLINLFFDGTRVKAGASRPRGVPAWKASKVGILGAGMMGAGIAYSCAMRDIDCVLKDVTREQAEKGKSYTGALTDKRIAKGTMSADKQAAVLNRILATDKVEDLLGCDLIIEAVYENRELKARVTREAEPMLAHGGILASNTSTLPISGLARASERQENFIGLHFFSPVDKMNLVEIIVGERTSEETLARAFDFVQQIGKIPIVVNDSRGFYTSRTFVAFTMEGAAMLEEGIPAAVIEHAALAAGMPVGPLAVTDETSLTLNLAVRDQERCDLEASGKRYTPPAGHLVIEAMVKVHQRGGRAAGGGFYDYPANARKSLWPGLKQHFEKPGHGYDFTDLSDRFLYRQALETLRCLQEGVLRSAHDANIGAIHALGFPAWTGGTYRFIEAQGLEAFTDRCSELAARYGERFTPPELPADWTPGQSG